MPNRRRLSTRPLRRLQVGQQAGPVVVAAGMSLCGPSSTTEKRVEGDPVDGVRESKQNSREEEGNARDGDLRIDLASGVAVISKRDDWDHDHRRPESDHALEKAGVDTIFGIPCGSILPAYDPLMSSSIRHVRARHE